MILRLAYRWHMRHRIDRDVRPWGRNDGAGFLRPKLKYRKAMLKGLNILCTITFAWSAYDVQSLVGAGKGQATRLPP